MENNHQDFQFKTNINCNSCIAIVKPHLDNLLGNGHWKVNISNKAKILTVEANGVTEKQIIETVQKAGYTIETISQ